jgi:hypothetical protein
MAALAADPQKPFLEPAALQIAFELLFYITWQRPTLVGAPIAKLRIVLGHEPIEQRRFRPVAPVAGWRDETTGKR